MPSFRDSSGKTWEVRVDVAAVKRVLELAHVDLRVIESGKTLADLALDPIQLVDTLYAVVKPQVDAAGLYRRGTLPGRPRPDRRQLPPPTGAPPAEAGLSPASACASAACSTGSIAA